MSDPGTAAINRIGSGAGRVARAWRALSHERRLAAVAAIGLFVTLFLPWYQETVIARSGPARLQSVSVSVTGWGAFSFFEAMALLVVAGVLTLLFLRAEGRDLHLPGGDGAAIVAGGGWASLLILWRVFDKQGTTGHGQYATASGIEWGIILALAFAVLLAYAGTRIRAADSPEERSRPAPGSPAPDPSSPAPGWPAPGWPAPDPRSPAPAAGKPSRRPAVAPTARQPPRPSGGPVTAAASERRRAAVAPGSRRAPSSKVEDPAATRVSSRPLGGPADDPAATRASARRRPAALFGPPVLPDDPPTMQLDPRAHTDDPPTRPLDGDA